MTEVKHIVSISGVPNSGKSYILNIIRKSKNFDNFFIVDKSQFLNSALYYYMLSLQETLYNEYGVTEDQKFFINYKNEKLVSTERFANKDKKTRKAKSDLYNVIEYILDDTLLNTILKNLNHQYVFISSVRQNQFKEIDDFCKKNNVKHTHIEIIKEQLDLFEDNSCIEEDKYIIDRENPNVFQYLNNTSDEKEIIKRIEKIIYARR